MFSTINKRYVDVILPLPMAKYFTYSYPTDIQPAPQIGSRVVVPFGRNKTYTGIVVEVHDRKPEEYDAKDILTVCDDFPILRPAQIKFWEWISDYYLCPVGDVYKAALPAALKNEEEEKGGYTPKQEEYVRLSFTRKEEDKLRKVYEDLGRSPKQLHVVMSYISLAQFMLQDTPLEVSKKMLYEKADINASNLKPLVDKGIFEIYKKEVSRLTPYRKAIQDSYDLNQAQAKAYDEIQASFTQKDVTLLFGVTGSGKTEIYIRMIEDTLSQGKQVLYLVPEIALTTQLTGRLQRVFGKRLGIYHSKFSGNERTEVWMNLLKEQDIDIILGVRSSIFLPFKDLGLIIVDEEHETTYKQYDPAPRYHARNAAIILAMQHKAKVLLGTATPAFETYMNALTGKYGFVELLTRHEGIELPEIVPVDIKELRRKKRMRSSFSPMLIEAVNGALEKNEQVILFQNRRGFAPLVECTLCAYVPKCKHCDVSLTYHKGLNQLTCHYCGYTQPVTRICPACGHHSLDTLGYGTERIEDEVREIFPEVKVERMDMDTTRSKKAYQEIIERFVTGETQVLIGTQMVSKGLDFENVSVVGILNADTLMNFPDFRSYERAYQLMAQVSGRAGRKNKRGLVILQTSDPKHPVVTEVITNNYKELFAQQMEERRLFKYPPFYRLIYIYLKHRDGILLDKMANEMAIRLRNQFGDRVLGPDNPPVARIQNLYIKKIVLKIETNISPARVKEQLHSVRLQMLEDDRFKSLIVYYDVDPL
ncbi:MAG: replication restart helicase PriA [Bacteroidales bacterium]